MTLSEKILGNQDLDPLFYSLMDVRSLLNLRLANRGCNASIISRAEAIKNQLIAHLEKEYSGCNFKGINLNVFKLGEYLDTSLDLDALISKIYHLLELPFRTYVSEVQVHYPLHVIYYKNHEKETLSYLNQDRLPGDCCSISEILREDFLRTRILAWNIMMGVRKYQRPNIFLRAARVMKKKIHFDR